MGMLNGPVTSVWVGGGLGGGITHRLVFTSVSVSTISAALCVLNMWFSGSISFKLPSLNNVKLTLTN